LAATRVYILAKELGVKSTSIVKKCQDEGLDVKNHMSTISAGLAATIREWFSEGEHITTVETAEKVDLTKVRIRKKVKRERPERKKKAVEDEAGAEVIGSVAVGTALEHAEQEETEAVKELPVEEKTEKKAKAKKKVRAKKAKKEKPEPIIPAGPMLERPEPAKLSGPEVVRVESLESEKRPVPKPRPKVRRRYDEPVTEPLMQVEAEAGKSKKGGKGVLKRRKDRTGGRRGYDKEVESDRKTKFESQRRQRDMEERRARLSAAGGEGMRVRPSRRIASKPSAGMGGPVTMMRPEKATMAEPVIVKDLSAMLVVKVSEVVERLMRQGVMASANQVVSPEVAELIAIDFGTELTVERKSTLEEEIKTEFESRERKQLKKRPVVVTMLGHVDHGKTSLLDKIRSTQVTAGEAGGITQHIGAYQVEHNGSKVTFLDTPGHEAFTAMRARGANMTDVVVLVVAADDGVMPQTVEAIHHAKAAEVPILVALNKSDLPGCDINRIYSQLSEHELTPTEWSGNTEVVKTSTMTGEGIDSLLEHLDYITELLELKADDTVPATGWVVEAKISPTQGTIATLLLKEGYLEKGSVLLAGGAYGRVKTMKNSFGKSVKKAVSAMPVEITGLSGVPNAGDSFYCLANINQAKLAAEEKQTRLRENTLAKRTQITLDNLFSHIEEGSVKELNIIIRADVQGSVDVLMKYLSDLSTDEVKIKIIHAATGGITEGDVVLAEASNAIVIGFNVVSDEHVARTAEEKGVDIRLYTVIYRITEDLQKSMVGLLEPEKQEKRLGRAVVRNTFKVSRIGTIGGSYIVEGVVNKKARVRLIRDSVVIHDNLEIESLKHFKNDVREVKADMECGIKLAKFDDIKIDDVMDFYEIIEVARSL
jgi:translation initiation factor IF-2